MLEYVGFYLTCVVVGIGFVYIKWFGHFLPIREVYKEFSVLCDDVGGVGVIYSLGGGLLVICAAVLLLSLFVVLEVVRGMSRGTLRAV